MFTKEILLAVYKIFSAIKSRANAGMLLIDRILEKGPENMELMDYYDLHKNVNEILTEAAKAISIIPFIFKK